MLHWFYMTRLPAPDVLVVLELLLRHGLELAITVPAAQQHKLRALVQAPAAAAVAAQAEGSQ